MSAREEWLDAVDKLAAEKVRGWEVKDFEVRVLRGSTADVIRHDDGTLWRRTGPNEWSASWYPTRSISDAWKLVEKLCDTPGPNGDHHTFALDYQSRGAIAVFDHLEDWEVSADADAAPLAITLAALKAVGCEVPEEPDDG